MDGALSYIARAVAGVAAAAINVVAGGGSLLAVNTAVIAFAVLL